MILVLVLKFHIGSQKFEFLNLKNLMLFNFFYSRKLNTRKSHFVGPGE